MRVGAAVLLFRLCFGKDPKSLFYWALIGVRQMACLCKLDMCVLLFVQLRSISTLAVINQLKRPNLRVQSSIWLQFFRLGSPPTLDGPGSVFALLVQRTLRCFRCGTPPQRIDFSPFSWCP